jgi:hypothetical protein
MKEYFAPFYLYPHLSVLQSFLTPERRSVAPSTVRDHLPSTLFSRTYLSATVERSSLSSLLKENSTTIKID